MFVYLSKKIAIPNGVKVRTLAWNTGQGWIAVGGEDKLLKVLKLEAARGPDDRSKGVAAPQNLSMNETLPGHQGNVLCATWNEDYRKLTTSDQFGLIIVWILHNGSWFEEMVNNRNQSFVRDMRWSGDGQKICISYEDGHVIVGSVEGSRLWGKELKYNLAHCCWDANNRNILFANLQGEVHLYDASGNFISAVTNHCVPDGAAGSSGVQVASLEWHDHRDAAASEGAPSLAIAYDNGRVQLMCSDLDENPVLVDTLMRDVRCKWNPQGTVLAISGSRTVQAKGADGAAGAKKEVSMVQFYSPHGQHLRTLKVPGTGIASLTWEGTGLRLALAVESSIYFANVRPDYKWGHFRDTVVYAFPRAERREWCVTFWNTETGDRYVKYVRKVVHIRGAGDNCVIVAEADPEVDDSAVGAHGHGHGYAAASRATAAAADGRRQPQTALILCNAIGSPVETKYVPIDPTHVTMTSSHVVVCSADLVYAWQYRTTLSKIALAAAPSRQHKEQMFHIDDTGYTTSNAPDRYTRPDARASKDPVAAVAASDKILCIGRESGTLLRFSLPHISLDAKHVLRCRPQLLAVNCDSTMVSIIDINGMLSFFDYNASPAAPGADAAGAGGGGAGDGLGGGAGPATLPGRSGGGLGDHLPFERKDAWDMCWSDDNPELFAMMEKTRMYIFRRMQPEEPVVSSAYICNFSDLRIKGVLLDEIMENPETPDRSAVIDFETKSLRDTNMLLETVGLPEALSFVTDHPHRKLWRILAEAALERLDFAVADKAFVECSDYQGILFVQRLKKLDDKRKQKAEVAAYFKHFEEAEEIYLQMDRKDLAIELRSRLGSWFRVVQLLQSGGGDDSLLTHAQSQIGDYYADRLKWDKAAQYYAQASNAAKLAECYYALEDFAGLRTLVPTIPESSPLLIEIGDRFRLVGLCEEAVGAFVRAGEAQLAIDACVELNQWDTAVRLAEQHGVPRIEGLLSKYATHLLDKGRTLEAVELYRKARHHNDAAHLLMGLGKDAMRDKGDILLAKKLYVLAALEVETGRRNPMAGAGAGARDMGSVVQQLEGMLAEAPTPSGPGAGRSLGNPWHGARAHHLVLLCQRSLYRKDANDIVAAMAAAQRLREYEDVLSALEIYSLIALTAFMNGHYQQCSLAFMKLETLPDIPPQKRAAFQDLALEIFTLHPPVDPEDTDRKQCPNCHAAVSPWQPACLSCDTKFFACMATGLPVINSSHTPVSTCKQCNSNFLEVVVRRMRNCPLCHFPLDPDSTAALTR